MVKLGSLYRNGSSRNIRQQAPPAETLTLDRLEFNQRVQERRLLQEERKHWDRLSPNHTQLQVRAYYLCLTIIPLKHIFFFALIVVESAATLPVGSITARRIGNFTEFTT